MAQIVSEHEQVTESSKDSGQTNEEQQSLIKKLNELFARAKRHRRRYDIAWQYNYEFVCDARQWPQQRPRWRFNESVNIIWASIMTEIGIQTDARPKFEYTYQEASDMPFAEVLKELSNSVWDKYHWNMVVQDGLFDCKLYHVAHAIVEWDPELAYGLGDPVFRMLDPFSCYWDPMASDVNKGVKCRYFIVAEERPTATLKEEYPDFADKIKSDISMIKNRNDYGVSAINASTAYDKETPTRLRSSTNYTENKYGGEPMSQFIRFWLRDDTLEEVCNELEEKDPETGENKKEYVLKKKYPTNRYIELCCNQVLRDTVPGVEIEDEWVAYEDDCFPIARLVNYQYPREYAGENEVSHTAPLQKITNYVWSYILDMFRMQSNPITIVGDASGIDEEEFTNEPGLILKAADINQIRREPGTPIAGGAFDLLQAAQSLFDKVQGLQDVSRGAEVTGVNSALMMEGYVEASQTRPRMKNRALECFLQDVGELVLYRILQFYTQPRVFRIVNKEGFPQQVEFYIPRDEAGNKTAKVNTQTQLPSGDMVKQAQQFEVKGIPDVRIITGSALPYSKAQKSQTALTYFNAGAIDEEELLKSVDWPNYKEVLKRLEEKKAAEAQAAAPQ
jgi:hypothetical protein